MKKKIALIVNTLSNGGAERVVSNLTLGFNDEYDCDIIVNDSCVVDYPIDGNVISLGMKQSSNRSSIIYQGKAFFVRLYKIKKLRKKNDYYAVVSFSDSANVANIFTRCKKQKTILSVHINISQASNEKQYKYIVAPLIKWLYNKADKIITVSDGIKNDLMKNYGINVNKMVVITNGCDNAKIAEWSLQKLTKDEEQWLSGENIIVTMGRLTRQKGQWHLLKAVSKLKNDGYKFKLLILGQGELEEYMKSLVSELELDNNVIFCGFCKNPFKLMKNADLFVSSSLWEGYPNNIVEAMSCGLPVVSSDFDSGAREIIAPETDVEYKNTEEIERAEYGILVPVCDGERHDIGEKLTFEENMLAEAIEQVLSDKKLLSYYALKSKARAEQLDMKYTASKWGDAIG